MATVDVDTVDKSRLSMLPHTTVAKPHLSESVTFRSCTYVYMLCVALTIPLCWFDWECPFYSLSISTVETRRYKPIWSMSPAVKTLESPSSNDFSCFPIAFFFFFPHDIKRIQSVFHIWQTLRRQAEQEPSDETTCDNDVLLHKHLRLKKTQKYTGST